MWRSLLVSLVFVSIINAQDIPAGIELNIDSTASSILLLDDDFQRLNRIEEIIRDPEFAIKTRIILGEWMVENIDPIDIQVAEVYKDNCNYLGQRLRNLGIVDKALYFYTESNSIHYQFNVSHSELINLGHLYHSQGDEAMAMDYYRQKLIESNAMAPSDPLKPNTLAWAKATIGVAIINQYPDSAITLIDEALSLWKSTALEFREQGAISYAYYRTASYWVAQDSADMGIVANMIDSMALWDQLDQIDTTSFFLIINSQYNNKIQDTDRSMYWSKKLLKRALEPTSGAINRKALSAAYWNLYLLYSKSGDDSLALYNYIQYDHHDYLLKNDRNQLVMQVFKSENAKILRDQEEQHRLHQERNKQLILGFSSLLFLLIAGGIYSRLSYVNKTKKQLEIEKRRSDELLLNILPSEVAEELKTTGEAKAKSFEEVTMLFTDFIDFTKVSSMLSAIELVDQVNRYFKKFDQIMEHFGVEKIKTIGDAYMAAGGLTEETKDSALNVVLAALEMQEFMNFNLNKEGQREHSTFNMRAGVHTGPVVAGIVGIKKFQYDVWGDTVNTANRLESCCELGKVNISQATYELIKTTPQLQFEERGLISVKGKGELAMWYVTR